MFNQAISKDKKQESNGRQETNEACSSHRASVQGHYKNARTVNKMGS